MQPSRIFIAVSVIALLLIFFAIYIPKPSESVLGSFKTPPPRANEYCHVDFKGAESSASTLQQSSGMKLQKLVILARHGARSSIHHIPGSLDDPLVSDCSTHDELMYNAFKAIKVYDLSDQKYSQNAENMLKPQKKRHCGPGQLSFKGAYQHKSIGEHLRDSYHAVLEHGIDPLKSYFRSTLYQRTLQSASSFAFAFFDGNMDNLTFNVFSEKQRECMLGIGPKMTTSDKKLGETYSKGNCDSAVKFDEKQAKSFELNENVKQKMGKVFGDKVEEMPVTHIADSLYVSACESRVLCTQFACVDEYLQNDIFEEADRYFCLRYTGMTGGKQSTLLSFYPFMKEVLEKINDENTNLVFFSGHDTVIAPVLAYLDAYDCKWPPFASRLVIEVWKRDEHRFLRFIYNGQVVSNKISGCSVEGLCPLKIFEDIVNRGKLDRPSHEDACNFGSP